MEVLFEDLKKDVSVEILGYIINHVVEAYRRKVPFNAWVVNVLKGHNRDSRHLYHVKDRL